MADFDMGMHPTATTDFNINTLHYMAKVGYDVFVGERVTVSANLGAGVLSAGHRWTREPALRFAGRRRCSARQGG